MNRDRVNPITYLVRRLSKTLSLNRGSITRLDSDDAMEYVHHPHVHLPSVMRRRKSHSTDRYQENTVPVRSASACPAPLASADCFDITDSSDVEKESKYQISKSKEYESVEGTATPLSCTSSEGTQSVENFVKDEAQPIFTYSGIPTDQIYDFSYPEIKRDEVEIGSISTIHQTSSSSGSESTDMYNIEINSSEDEVVHNVDVSEYQPLETKRKDSKNQSAYIEVYQESNNEDYNYSQFETHHDREQGQFHEAMFLVESQKSPPHPSLLNTPPPAILVTSPSNHDITQKSPSIPGPPVEKTSPPPVPPPPKEISHNSTEIPQRPPPIKSSSKPVLTSAEASPNASRKKKHKIFGISVGKCCKTNFSLL